MTGDKFMPEMHLKQPLDLPLVVVGHLNSDPPFCHFLLLSSSNPSPFPSEVLFNIAMGGILCDYIMSNPPKI